MNQKELRIKIRQARLRRMQLRQALLLGGHMPQGTGAQREKRLQRFQQALAARKQALKQALEHFQTAEAKISDIEHRMGHTSDASGGGRLRAKAIERAQRALEIRRERVERLLNSQNEIEEALRKRLQHIDPQVSPPYDPAVLSGEDDEAQPDAAGAGANAGGNGGGGSATSDASTGAVIDTAGNTASNTASNTTSNTAGNAAGNTAGYSTGDETEEDLGDEPPDTGRGVSRRGRRG